MHSRIRRAIAGSSIAAISRVAAVVAVQAQEAVGEDAAAQEGPELLLDEVRRRTLTGSRAGQEGLELLAEDPVAGRLLGGARRVSVVGMLRFRHRAAAEMRLACRVRARRWSWADDSRVRAFTTT